MCNSLAAHGIHMLATADRRLRLSGNLSFYSKSGLEPGPLLLR
jgi:hypothetical protein